MSQIKLEGVSLDSFIDDVTTICELDRQVVEDIIKTDLANWLGIDYSSVTYAFVYLSDILKTFEDAYDDENDDEIVVLDAIRTMDTNKESDYFVVFAD
jgi:hypothetical protein